MHTAARKSVLFHYPILNTGGAEVSSLRLMVALADRGWDVTLVLTTGGGHLESRVDPRIRLVCLRPQAFGNRFIRARGLVAKLMALPDLFAYGVTRLIGVVRMAPFLFRRYDAACTLLHGTSTWFCRRVVRADILVHWIRNDLSQADPDGRTVGRIRRAQGRIDHYVCVSEVVRQSLVAAAPELASKATVIHNILNVEEMRELMKEGGDPFPARRAGVLRVLTVCRLNERAKALTRMVRIHRRLADQGLDFSWFIVGNGPGRELLNQSISEQGLQDRMILLGEQSNPFPFYKYADIAAMLSRYEGLCGTVNEAKVAGLPVIATRVSGIGEQLVDGENGLVVENEEGAIAEGLRRLILDPALRSRLTNAILPPNLMDDEAKLDRLEALLLRKSLP